MHLNNQISHALYICIALSIWTSYSQISNCQAVANDMQKTAIAMAEKADQIEKIKQEDVDPLLKDVKTKVVLRWHTT